MASRVSDRRRTQLRKAKQAQRVRERSRGMVHLQLTLPRELAAKLRAAHRAPDFASALERFLDDLPGVEAEADLARQIDALIDQCRSTCLWFQRSDYYPRTRADRLRVLDAIQRHADRETFIRAGRLKRCLSPISSVDSAGS
ncbi:MAG: hypothetical protein HY901_31370 [Deltaproteobacteria bacterium]|nr:hypothetical protein [Deltaproteobacteria bacterium]